MGDFPKSGHIYSPVKGGKKEANEGKALVGLPSDPPMNVTVFNMRCSYTVTVLKCPTFYKNTQTHNQFLQPHLYTGVFKSVVLCILAHVLSSAKEMADSSEIR